MKHAPVLATLPLLMGACFSPAFAAEDIPRVNENGLRLVADRELDQVYIDDTRRLPAFTSVYIEAPSVAFRKNWARNLNRQQPGIMIYPEDEEKLLRDYADLTYRVFSETLQERGFVLSDAPGEGVLVVRPDIVDMDIVAPDIQRAARVDRYSDSAGEMTLSLTLADGVTGLPVVQVSDHKEDPRWGYMEWRTRPSNYSDARRALRSWANTLSDALEDGRWSG